MQVLKEGSLTHLISALHRKNVLRKLRSLVLISDIIQKCQQQENNNTEHDIKWSNHSLMYRSTYAKKANIRCQL